MRITLDALRAYRDGYHSNEAFDRTKQPSDATLRQYYQDGLAAARTMRWGSAAERRSIERDPFYLAMHGQAPVVTAERAPSIEEDIEQWKRELTGEAD